MHIVEIQERRIEGLCVRTCNADEADPYRVFDDNYLGRLTTTMLAG